MEKDATSTRRPPARSSQSTAARRAVERFPDSARANFEHGFHLQKVGDIEDAVRYLKKAIELDPSYEEPPFFLGDLLMKLGQTEEAIPYLRNR